MKQIILGSLFLGLIFTNNISCALAKTEQQLQENNESVLITIDDIPDHCASLVQKLCEQPLQTDGWAQGFPVKECRILPLDQWDDCMICEFLSNEFRRYTKIVAYNKLHRIPHSLILYTNDPEYNGCPPDELKAFYKKAIDNLKVGWQKSTLDQNHDIFFPKTGNSWLLFIKRESSIFDEALLIRYLCSKFGFYNNDLADADNIWVNMEEGYEYRKAIYLWVRKDAFNDFQKVFGFEIKD
ncbi:MAG: hypothetical protein WCT20_01170 [Candidatus Babeliales bacterium]|jgi:hypothetical protein